jgi:hypothetical protein
LDVFVPGQFSENLIGSTRVTRPTYPSPSYFSIQVGLFSSIGFLDQLIHQVRHIHQFSVTYWTRGQATPALQGELIKDSNHIKEA